MKLRLDLLWIIALLLIIGVIGGGCKRWIHEEPFFLVVGEFRPKGYDMLGKELHRKLPMRYWRTHSFQAMSTAGGKKRIKDSHTVFLVAPDYLYQGLGAAEEKYPDLLPLSLKKLESYLGTYGSPLLYFSRDSTGKIRGVIIAEVIDSPLINFLTKDSVPLDTPVVQKKLEQTSTQEEAYPPGFIAQSNSKTKTLTQSAT